MPGDLIHIPQMMNSTPQWVREGFAQRLAMTRELSGYPSMASFARKIGIEEETYRRYERAETEPPLWVLAKIQAEAEVSLDFLISGVVPKPQA